MWTRMMSPSQCDWTCLTSSCTNAVTKSLQEELTATCSRVFCGVNPSGVRPRYYPGKNPTTLQVVKESKEKGLWHREEIWPQCYRRPKGSRSARLRHLASALWPSLLEQKLCPSLQGSFERFGKNSLLWSRTRQDLTPQKTSKFGDFGQLERLILHVSIPAPQSLTSVHEVMNQLYTPILIHSLPAMLRCVAAPRLNYAWTRVCSIDSDCPIPQKKFG